MTGAPGLEDRGALQVVAAKKGGKKGGGKKGGGKKKGPGSLMDMAKPKQPFENVEVVMLNLLMIESFRRNVGRPLLDDIEITEAAKAMWDADFAIVACDLPDWPTGQLADLAEAPTITYANAAALDMLGQPWDDVVGKPAADVYSLEELAAAQHLGCQAGYSGRLVTAAGEVTVTGADVWAIESPAAAGAEGDDNVDASQVGRGMVMGQGLVFKTWTLPDGSLSGVGMAVVAMPTPEELAEAEKAVEEQGQLVRGLKDSGLTNQDDQVAEAVGELLARKERLAEMQARKEVAAAGAAAE